MSEVIPPEDSPQAVAARVRAKLAARVAAAGGASSPEAATPVETESKPDQVWSAENAEKELGSVFRAQVGQQAIVKTFKIRGVGGAMKLETRLVAEHWWEGTINITVKSDIRTKDSKVEFVNLKIESDKAQDGVKEKFLPLLKDGPTGIIGRIESLYKQKIETLEIRDGKLEIRFVGSRSRKTEPEPVKQVPPASGAAHAAGTMRDLAAALRREAASTPATSPALEVIPDQSGTAEIKSRYGIDVSMARILSEPIRVVFEDLESFHEKVFPAIAPFAKRFPKGTVENDEYLSLWYEYRNPMKDRLRQIATKIDKVPPADKAERSRIAKDENFQDEIIEYFKRGQKLLDFMSSKLATPEVSAQTPPGIRVLQTPDAITPAAAEREKMFDGPEYNLEKLSHDRVYRFFVEELGMSAEEIAEANFSYYAVIRTNDPNNPGGTIVQEKRFKNDHDYSLWWKSLSAEEKASMNANWMVEQEVGGKKVEVKVQNPSLHCSKSFWEKIEDPDAPYHPKLRQLIEIWKFSLRCELPDEYSNAVARGEVIHIEGTAADILKNISAVGEKLSQVQIRINNLLQAMSDYDRFNVEERNNYIGSKVNPLHIRKSELVNLLNGLSTIHDPAVRAEAVRRLADGIDVWHNEAEVMIKNLEGDPFKMPARQPGAPEAPQPAGETPATPEIRTAEELLEQSRETYATRYRRWLDITRSWSPAHRQKGAERIMVDALQAAPLNIGDFDASLLGSGPEQAAAVNRRQAFVSNLEGQGFTANDAQMMYAVAAARVEYFAARMGLGQELLDAKRKELEGRSDDEIEAEIERYKKGALSQQLVVNERLDLQDRKVQWLADKFKRTAGFVGGAFAAYNTALGPRGRLLVSMLISAGAIYATGGAAAFGTVARFGILRPIISLAVAQGARFGYRGWKREKRESIAQRESAELVAIGQDLSLDPENLATQDIRMEKARSDRKWAEAKLAFGEILMTAGAAGGTSMLYGHFLHALQSGGGASRASSEAPAASPKPTPGARPTATPEAMPTATAAPRIEPTPTSTGDAGSVAETAPATPPQTIIAPQEVAQVAPPAAAHSLISEVQHQGDTFYKLAQQQIESSPYANEFAGLDPTHRTWLIETMKHELHGSDSLRVGDHVDFSRTFNDPDHMQALMKAAKELDPEKVKNILANDTALREWRRAHPGARLDTAQTEKILHQQQPAGTPSAGAEQPPAQPSTTGGAPETVPADHGPLGDAPAEFEPSNKDVMLRYWHWTHRDAATGKILSEPPTFQDELDFYKAFHAIKAPSADLLGRMSVQDAGWNDPSVREALGKTLHMDPRHFDNSLIREQLIADPRDLIDSRTLDTYDYLHKAWPDAKSIADIPLGTRLVAEMPHNPVMHDWIVDHPGKTILNTDLNEMRDLNDMRIKFDWDSLPYPSFKDFMMKAGIDGSEYEQLRHVRIGDFMRQMPNVRYLADSSGTQLSFQLEDGTLADVAATYHFAAIKTYFEDKNFAWTPEIQNLSFRQMFEILHREMQ